MSISENLRKLRMANGVSQTIMAEKLNISRQSYNHYETGRREPDYNMLLKISKLLHASPNDILGLSSDTTTQNKKSSFEPVKDPELENDIIELRNIAESLKIEDIKYLIKFAKSLKSEPD
ncbi:MAG: helix-turn-helix domain-containing protein [Oscillospiraceae bacterium]|nr:helix-turn-helix domain-containing protein [Oscillospiraceae bacterium]